MKIFGKRKRKSASTDEADKSATEPRTSFASDPVVEDLLKMDPSQWNSKQKRMIKRYKERKSEGASSNQHPEETSEKETAVKIESAESTALDATEKLVEKSIDADDKDPEKEASPPNQEDEKSDENSNKSSNISSHSDGGSDDDESGGGDERVPVKKLEEEENQEEYPKVESIADVGPPVDVEQPKKESSDSGVSEEDDVWALLEKLKSKSKRTLSRKLKRDGQAVLEEVRDEARRILAGEEEKAASSGGKKRDHDSTTVATTTSQDGNGKKKRKKQKVDWSKLPPEERLRREEQRRLQQEAAERRSRGEDGVSPHKHPLNSERRRANRRKPKWNKNKGGANSFADDGFNHNASGYQHRKRAPDQSYY